jgi:hypothetical protein
MAALFLVVIFEKPLHFLLCLDHLTESRFATSEFCFAVATFNFLLVVDLDNPIALLVSSKLGIYSVEPEPGAIAVKIVLTKRDSSSVLQPLADPVALASFNMEHICSQ